mgnify:CR=1 FL=1
MGDSTSLLHKTVRTLPPPLLQHYKADYAYLQNKKQHPALSTDLSDWHITQSYQTPSNQVKENRRLDAVFEEALISENLAVDWIMETELMQKKREPLPTAVPGEKLPTNVERFLEASKEIPILVKQSLSILKRELGLRQ